MRPHLWGGHFGGTISPTDRAPVLYLEVRLPKNRRPLHRLLAVGQCHSVEVDSAGDAAAVSSPAIPADAVASGRLVLREAVHESACDVIDTDDDMPGFFQVISHDRHAIDRIRHHALPRAGGGTTRRHRPGEEPRCR